MWNKPHLLNALADLLVLVAAAALLAAAAVWLVRVPALPIKQVVFAEPLPHTRRGEVEQVLPAALKGNFFSLNLDAVRARWKAALGAQGDVRRIWPAKLEISIEEHKPVARWGEGRSELVNSYGEVFAAQLPDEESVGLPLLFGPNGTAPEVLTHYGNFVEAFKTVGETPVQVTLSPRLAWQVKLQNGMLVDIGREQTKAPVGVRLATVYRDLSGNGRQTGGTAGRRGFAVSEWFRDASGGRGRGSKHMSRDNKDLVVGLDIGTSKIVALVAEINNEGNLNVIGMGSQDSRGLKKGVVVNIEDTVHTISRVIQEVELMADCKVSNVYTGIAGSHIKSFNSNGMVAIKDKEVTPSDVERVIETARAMPIPADQEILHILTQEFVIDGQDGIREPIGMSGMRLEVKTHIVTGAVGGPEHRQVRAPLRPGGQ
jgi:cell division septal protein FtsQ